MIRKLLIVFASGFLLSIISLSAAWAVGGTAMMARIQKDGNFTFDDDGDGGRRETTVTRTLAYDGKVPLTVDMPVELDFVRGDKVEMTVSGPAKIMDALRWENGKLSLATAVRLRNRGIQVTITAPQLAGLVLSGPGDVELRDLDQPTLALTVTGPADVEASGRIETLNVETHGVGSLDLANLFTRDAKVNLTGVGSLDLNASGKVEADISGAGSISLHRKPAMLTSRVSGVGSIDHDY